MLKIKILIFALYSITLILNAQEARENPDSCNLTCQRYFYYLDVVRDYLNGYAISKDFFSLSLSAIEETSNIKSKIILEDFGIKYYESDYNDDMKSWINWYVDRYCNLSNKELKYLYKRYFPLKRKEYKCPCDNLNLKQ